MKFFRPMLLTLSLLPALPLVLARSSLGAQSPAPMPPAPLTLRVLLDTVAASHPLVRAGESHVRAARGNRLTARALGNPILSYDVENTPFPGGTSAPGVDRETMTTAMIPLEPFYQRWSRVRAADATVGVAEAERTQLRQRTALDAATAYYRVALAQVGVATARDLVAWLDTLVSYNRARVAEGVASESDLLRATLERDRAAAEATLQEAELARARAQLASFLGDPRRVTIPQGIAIPEFPLALAVTADDTAQGALDRRPDVRAARSRLDAARAAVTGERTMIVREFGATIGTKQMAGNTSMIAGFSLPLPLFDLNRGQVQRATAEREGASLALVAEERAAAADLLGAAESARLLTEYARRLTAEGAEGLLARADEARRVGVGAYREGAMPLYQVLDVVRAWGDARMTFYQTLYAQHLGVLELLVAQGSDLFTNLPASAGPAAPNR